MKAKKALDEVVSYIDQSCEMLKDALYRFPPLGEKVDREQYESDWQYTKQLSDYMDMIKLNIDNIIKKYEKKS